ncbi:hypothetical protein [Alteromonas sp. a30]|uniref:hypothetical protein n=1 Tax=Alteromonas sp. a30 TaxID=2730917 RepID=UPI0022814BBB|nr:hypothetical protein [Alteromonas sp. a30]MCY7295069.1 hypothetical protein [Alteromonas sp. a30]
MNVEYRNSNAIKAERDNNNAWFVGACWRLVWAAIVGFILLLTLDAQSAVFDSEFSQNPATVPLETVIRPSNYAGLHLSKQEAGERFCAEQTNILQQSADNLSQYSNFTCFWYDPNTIRLEYTFTTYWSDGEVREQVQGGRGTLVITEVTQVPQCPPEDPQFIDYTYGKEIENGLGCFNLDDVLARDSCPDSVNDGAFVLPQLDNTASKICHAKDDGSLCAYDLNEGVYVANFEENRSCYTEDNPDTYDDSSLDPQEDNNQCHDIGNGVLACPEDPNNVCNDTSGCQSGCGTVAVNGSEPVFMCLSDDTDGDGIGDYADPDIDGDGIPNEQDLDNDGDGIDDPVYDNGNSAGGSNQTINIDLTQTNNLLNQIKSGVDDLGNTLGNTLDNIEDELKADFTEGAAGRTCNALCDLFSEDDLNQIQNDISSATTEFHTLVDSVKAEASRFFKFDVNFTTFESYSWDFGWAAKTFSLESFREYFDLMGIIVLIIAGLTAIKVVLS